MVMNATEMKKETEKRRSQRVLHNVEAIFQNYISVAMKRGEGETTLTWLQVYLLTGKIEIGEVEIQYFEELGYVVSILKWHDYIIIWDEKSKALEQEKAKKEKIIIKRNKIIISAFFIVVSMLYYCYPIIHIIIFVLMLILVISIMIFIMQLTPRYMYVTKNK